MSIISFVWQKAYFYFIIYWSLQICVDVAKPYIEKNYNIGITTNLENEYINVVSLNIADLLAGFLVLYTKYSFSYKKKTKRKNSSKSTQLIYSDPTEKEWKLFLLIFISILDFISRSVYLFFFLLIKPEIIFEKHQQNFIIAIDIFSRYLLSRIILKTKIYKHHIFSIIISLTGYILMSTFDLITILRYNNNSASLKFYFFLFIILRSFLFPFEDVINQILLSNDFLIPHFLMWDRGLIEFPLLIIITIIIFFTKKFDFEKIKANHFA